MINAARMIMIKMKITTISLSLRGIINDNDSDYNKGSYSSKNFIIITFINQYTKILYHYINLSIPNSFWNKSHVLFLALILLLL